MLLLSNKMYLIKSQWKPVLIRGYVTGANVVNIIIDTNRYLFVETFCPEISLKHVFHRPE